MRTAAQADNVVRLERPADADAAPAAEPPPAAEPEKADGDAGYAEILAPLDTLMKELNARDSQKRPAHEEEAANASTAAPGYFDAALAQAAANATAPAGPTPAAPRVAAFASPADGVAFINPTHFMAPLAGEMTVWRRGIDPETGAPTVTPVSTNSFRLEFAPYTADVPAPGGGAKSMPLADLWLRSKHRREYPGGVGLWPEGPTPSGCYNLWNGFAVARLAGDASPMVDHVHMLCSGNAPLKEYVLNWLAHCVQQPGARPEVALVLRGGRGTGKGTAFRVMLKIFGRHGLHITQPKHLVGNFNSHLRSALFLFADECHPPSDKAAEGVLKGLITEPTLAIEMKGRDVFTAPNHIKLAMASNNDWVVPAGADERRYCVIDVPKDRAQDHAYFAALHAWIDGDGAAIFLDHLLNRDLSGFNVRAVPSTAGLDRQKVEGMPAIDRWILEALDTAVGLASSEWTEAPHHVGCTTAATALDQYCRRSAVRGARPDSRTIGRRLVEVFGCAPATVARHGHSSQRVWLLPGLTRARNMAASAFGLTQYVWGQA